MNKLPKFSYGFITLLLLIGLVACSDDKKAEKESDENVYQTEHVSLEIDHTTIPAENWKDDGSHQKLVTGKVLADNKPVVGAEVQISNKRKTTTDEKGTFTALIDANKVEKDYVHVLALDKATVEGKKLSKDSKESLLDLEQELTVYYPIEIDKVIANEQDANLIDVHAHAVVKGEEKFPKFSVEKFPVKGTILDADGNPIEGATVNLRRDGVEGFTMSEPSNDKGEYIMQYIPEDDENHYLNVYVPSEDKTYTLPEGKAFLFPDDSGIELNIVLPKEGTVIKDEPPTLVAKSGVKGALYKGVLIGSSASDYSITIPERDGSFVVTMSKTEWESNPDFYEINFNEFFDHYVQLGDTLSSKVIPQPTKHEPSHIVTVDKN